MLGSLSRLQCLDKVGAWRASKHRLGGVFSPLEIDCFDPSFGTCLRLSTGESGLGGTRWVILGVRSMLFFFLSLDERRSHHLVPFFFTVQVSRV